MNITLLTHTPDPLRVMFTAAHCCYSPKAAADIWHRTAGGLTEVKGDDVFNAERMLRTVRGCIRRNHNTVMRHATFTFAMDGLSRACATQLTRHGPGWAFPDEIDDPDQDDPAFDQQSQRYVPYETEPEWVIPPHLSETDAYWIRKSAGDSWNEYRMRIGSGVKPEDARAVLPACTPTNMVATVNLAAFLHFWAVRRLDATGKAQAEIKTLADRMGRLIVDAEPWLGEFLEGVAA